MKINISPKQIKQLADGEEQKVSLSDPWWVIVAKIIVYALGLLLAGYGTASAATMTMGVNLMPLFG